MSPFWRWHWNTWHMCYAFQEDPGGRVRVSFSGDRLIRRYGLQMLWIHGFLQCCRL